MCALGLESRLTGRSHECDYPASITERPVLTRPKYSTGTHQTSPDIHWEITHLLQQALSVYEVDSEKLAELNPDTILTQDHCDVCAVSMADLKNSVLQTLGAETEIISVSPSDLESIFESFKLIGGKLGVAAKATELVESIKTRFDEIRNITSALPKPEVVAIEWMDPLMAGGNWIPEMIEIAGGRSNLTSAGEHSGWIEWDKIRNADPDILLILPCGYSIGQTLNEMDTLEEKPGWSGLKSVQQNRVYILDGSHYFNRPGPRIRESVEILTQIFHPDIFDRETKHPGWKHYGTEG